MNNEAIQEPIKKGMDKIPEQVKLPLAIAFGVVIQGLKIRIGRSIVTITGVVCGIAFLMSILTGQLVKKGVAEEDATRIEVGRVMSFIRGELPKFQDRTVGIVGDGTLSEVETRVATAFTKELGASKIILQKGFAPKAPRAIPGTSEGDTQTADIIFLMGSPDYLQKGDFDFRGFTEKANNSIIATTISDVEAKQINVDEARFVKLARELTDEEKAKIEADKVKEKFRNTWIAIISLLVTVIGITNAMLMSVTERFREIGTMKCLGALSSFVTEMFVLEASLMGVVGGVVGAIFGAIFAIVIYIITYGAGLVLSSMPLAAVLLYALYSVIAGVVLSIISALYPARVAAAMVPATALRSTV